MSERIAVGIDLGTTFSCVGLWKDGRVQIITNQEGQRTTPSYVSYTKSEVLVGKPSLRQVLLNPSNTIYDMKRLIGNKNASESLNQNGKYWTFKVVCDSETVVELNVDGEKNCIKPEEVSSLVLIKLKKAAEDVAQQPITDIVLTVPAYFDEYQKEATIEAAELAGLNVLELISEPSAAAYAYEYNKRDASNLNLLVFDLGGGKLDVVILKVKNGNFDVVTIGGDTQLGGRDFDNLLMDYFVDILVEKYNKDIREKDEKSLQAQQKLLQECIDLKHSLTSAEDSKLYLGEIFPDINENIEMSRSTFNQICFNLLDRIETVISETLKEADMTPKDINEIVLVGGSSRIPKIEELLLKIFQIKELNKSLNLDEAIAYGATLRATQIINNSIPNIQLTEANASRLRGVTSQLEHLVIEPTTSPNSTYIDEDKLIQSRVKVCEAINENDLNKIIGILDKQPKEFLNKCLNDPLRDARLLFRDTRLLVLAAKEGLDNIVKYLVSKGADPNLTGSIAIGDETIYEATPLWTAAYFGHLKTVKLLVEHGSLIDKGTDTKCTPVRAACYEGHLEIVNFLVEHGADIEIANNKGDSCLIAATYKNHENVVNFLLEKIANPNKKDNYGFTALHEAVLNADDNKKIVEMLLNYGAEIDSQDSSGCTPLMSAARNNNIEVVRCLLDKGANSNKKDNTGLSALYYAAYENDNKKLVEMLLKYGAEIDSQESSGCTSLMTAARNNHIEVVQCLLEEGANPNKNNNNGLSALHYAADNENDNEKIVEMLLKYQAEIDSQDSSGCTSLMTAARNNHIEVVQCLLKNGANTNIKDNIGLSALHHVARNNDNRKIVEMLLKYQAEIDNRNSSGCTPLITASHNNYIEVVQCLLEKGANSKIKNNNGLSALHYAACNDNKKIVEMLLNYGAEIDSQDSLGRTPLMAAAHNNIIEVVQCLLEKDANPNIKDNHGNTALHYATGNKDDNNAIALDDNNAIVKLLLEYGADNVLGL